MQCPLPHSRHDDRFCSPYYTFSVVSGSRVLSQPRKTGAFNITNPKFRSSRPHYIWLPAFPINHWATLTAEKLFTCHCVSVQDMYGYVCYSYVYGYFYVFLGAGVSLKEIFLISFFLPFFGIFFVFKAFWRDYTSMCTLLCILWLRFRPVFVLEKLIKRTRKKTDKVWRNEIPHLSATLNSQECALGWWQDNNQPQSNLISLNLVGIWPNSVWITKQTFCCYSERILFFMGHFTPSALICFHLLLSVNSAEIKKCRFMNYNERERLQQKETQMESKCKVGFMSVNDQSQRIFFIFNVARC